MGDPNEFERKHEKLIEMATELEEKLKEGFKKKAGEEEGYFGKVLKKMIDNLQVKIKNIHLRIESDTEDIGKMR